MIGAFMSPFSFSTARCSIRRSFTFSRPKCSRSRIFCAFSTLVAGQLGYALTCRASETRPDPRFVRLLGTAVGLQAAVLLLPPLGAMLRLPVASPISMAGFAFGLVAPLAVRAAARLALPALQLSKG